LTADNAEAWELWQTVRTQWRGAGFGVIGLDYGVVFEMADRMSVDWTPAMHRKLMALEDATMKRINARPEK
jgi:hypothetical protein